MGSRHDGELLGRCAHNPVAFEDLVVRHQPSLIRYANRRSRVTRHAASHDDGHGRRPDLTRPPSCADAVP
jgi:hypothetical protein